LGPVRRAAAVVDKAPELYFLISAVFHYLGPAFAVLLFTRIDVLGVAWLRIVSAAVIFAAWRKPWRAFATQDGEGKRLLIAWGTVLAVMNACFYTAIDRLPLGTVAAIEFLPVIALAALGARTARNAAALLLAVPGVYLLTDLHLTAEPLGLVFAFANATLHRARRPRCQGARTQRHRRSRGVHAHRCPRRDAHRGLGRHPRLQRPDRPSGRHRRGRFLLGHPYVTDQLALKRLDRATYALMVSLLPATATVIGIAVLTQIPTPVEIIGVTLVVVGVALHRQPRTAA